MALTERSRATLYRWLSDLIHDEEAVGEMLSNLPAYDIDQVATKDFVRAEVGEVRAEIAELRTEIARSANRMVIWALGFNVTMVGLVFAIARTV
ncbi:hypothetical protein PO878_09365 [Iamia majanohamensis]|uniref:DUF1640 domain-containing protein n=1 Tax=Iamia majanohamensis TaxID=467976 RepID=A0AAF0BSU5_9ACTN|nr:hypothetical protein [Iamia majanohamensis]WCO68931.1 hypothetical protein PO878_09365 [Iamia majanohamensis]